MLSSDNVRDVPVECPFFQDGAASDGWISAETMLTSSKATVLLPGFSMQLPQKKEQKPLLFDINPITILEGSRNGYKGFDLPKGEVDDPATTSVVTFPHRKGEVVTYPHKGITIFNSASSLEEQLGLKK